MALRLSATTPTSNGTAFEVDVPGLGRYDIQISLPAGYHDSAASYPVIFVLDGNLFFDTVHALVNGGGVFQQGLMPSCIVAGIGYPAYEGMASYYARRNYDFYGPWEMTDQVGQLLQRVFQQLKAREGNSGIVMTAGGAPRFMSFLRDELQPVLAERFRIDSAARHMLIGNSSGGHFALRAMFDPDSPFRRYVCISPAVGCASGSIERVEAEYSATHDDLDVEAFLCAGSREMDNPVHALARVVSGVCWVREQLAIRDYPSARIAAEIMPGEHHGLITARALGRALNFIFSQDEILRDRIADLTVQPADQ